MRNFILFGIFAIAALITSCSSPEPDTKSDVENVSDHVLSDHEVAFDTLAIPYVATPSEVQMADESDIPEVCCSLLDIELQPKGIAPGDTEYESIRHLKSIDVDRSTAEPPSINTGHSLSMSCSLNYEWSSNKSDDEKWHSSSKHIPDDLFIHYDARTGRVAKHQRLV